MAQLPPKVPNLTPNSSNPPWAADEFLNFSVAKRGFHRRSVSDSIAFLETPMQLDRDDQPAGMKMNNGFDEFDIDEQFQSMFRDDNATALGPIEDNPTSSDQSSFKDEKEETPYLMNEEVQSQCKSELQKKPNNAITTTNISMDRITDPKKVKRILANRQSAQRSRVRKLQYITELERSVTSLQAEVSMLSPHVAFLDQQRLLLNVDNSDLKQRIAALSQDKIFKDAHQEALKREIDRLGELYRQQNHMSMEYNVAIKEAIPSPPPDQKEKLLYV